MSLKDAAEKSPALYVLGLLVIGFTAGVGSLLTLQQITGQGHANEVAQAETKSQALAEQVERLEAEIAALRDSASQGGAPAGGSVGGANHPTKAVPTGPSQPAIQEAHPWVFQLLGCQKTGTAASCRLQVTNTGPNTKLRLFARDATRLYESAGREAAAVQLTLGEFSGKSRVDKTMITGIPIEAQVDFQGIPATASSAAVIRLEYASVPGRAKTIEFLEVPLEVAR